MSLRPNGGGGLHAEGGDGDPGRVPQFHNRVTTQCACGMHADKNVSASDCGTSISITVSKMQGRAGEPGRSAMYRRGGELESRLSGKALSSKATGLNHQNQAKPDSECLKPRAAWGDGRRSWGTRGS